MGYAVLNIKKGKGAGSGLGNHIDRKVGSEHSYHNADPSRKELNRKYAPNKYCKFYFAKAVEERLKDGYKSDRKIRTDAVKYCTAILSGSHIDMKLIEKDNEKMEAWVNANYNFMASNYGSENIVRFDLHLDEKTPHIHCCFVPITTDGRLSAKEVMGNKKDMTKLQDNYAVAMKQFGLKRGLRSSKKKHETAQQYDARVKNTLNPDQNTKLIALAQERVEQVIRQPKVSDRLNIDKFRDEAVASAKKLITNALKHQKKELAPFESENASLKREVARYKGHLNQMQKNFGELNKTEYSVKHGKDEILFKRGNGQFKVDVEFIEKELSKQNYEFKVEQILKLRCKEVTNAYYQNAKNKNDLSIYRYDDLKVLAKEIAQKVHTYNESQTHKIEGKSVDITISAKNTSSGKTAYFIYYPDFEKTEGDDKKIGVYIPSVEEIAIDLTSSLFNEQQRLLTEIQRKEREELKRKNKGQGYDGEMSM